MKKKIKTKAQSIKEGQKLYQEVLRSLNPMIRKYGIPKLRWALNRWNKTEGEKNYWLRRKSEAEEELKKY